MASVTKSWAFLTTHGKDWLTAEAIARERVLKYQGEPTGEIYYSAHTPGKRKRMKHVMKKNMPPFFSFIEPGDGGGGDGGESLTHRLFKQAIASIEATELRLGAHGDHKIRVTHASTEKRFPTTKEYYADVFLTFESETYLGTKWSGELYVEVHKTNAVHATKQDDLRASRMPVIEVGVPDLFKYSYNDSQTTDSREAQHLGMIKRVLEKGFLMGQVISNPSSVTYLELQLASTERNLISANTKLQSAMQCEQELREQIQELEQKAAQESDNNAKLAGALNSENVKLRSATEREQSLRGQMRDLEKAIARETETNIQLGLKLTAVKSEVHQVNESNISLTKKLNATVAKLKLRTNWLMGIGSVLLFGIIVLLLRYFYFK